VTPEKRRASLWVEASLLLTVFFFGTNFVAVKHVVENVPPILFAAVRFTFAGMLLWLLLRLVEPESRLERKDFLPVLGLGVVGVTLTQSVFTVGVSMTTAANTALIYSTAPVWGMLLGFVLALERPRLSGVLGVGLCLGGVALIVYGGLSFSGTSLAGDALILAAAIFWGSYTVLSLFLLRRYPPLALAAYTILLGGLAAFPLSAFDFGLRSTAGDRRRRDPRRRIPGPAPLEREGGDHPEHLAPRHHPKQGGTEVLSTRR
jgi:drug/metabolite transporter (DMT)-like permease